MCLPCAPHSPPPACLPASLAHSLTLSLTHSLAQIMGRPPADLIADYEERLGPAPESVRAFFHALAE